MKPTRPLVSAPLIHLLVVTYKTVPSESDSINSILGFSRSHPEYSSNLSLTVWDNSPVSRMNEFQALFAQSVLSWSYISTRDNICLSRIYNTIAGCEADFEYLCILDQDTMLSPDYFLEAATLAERGVTLALPKIIAGGFLFSPSRRKFCLGRHFNDIQPGERDSKNMLAINSGMLIKRSVFERFRYDERICFYGTDTWFMVQYEKNFKKLHVMNTVLHHALQKDRENSSAWLRNYYRTQIKVNAIIYRNGLLERIVTYTYGLYLKLFYARG